MKRIASNMYRSTALARKFGGTVGLLAVFFFAGGTSGTSCNGTIPGGGGGGGGGGGTGGGKKPTILSSDHILGDASASITVVEYADFQ